MKSVEVEASGYIRVPTWGRCSNAKVVLWFVVPFLTGITTETKQDTRERKAIA